MGVKWWQQFIFLLVKAPLKNKAKKGLQQNLLN